MTSDARDDAAIVVMPACNAAERSVLGACLLDNELLPEVITGLRESDLSLDAHRKLYRAMAALHDAGRPIDLLTLTEELLHRHELDAIGGAGYIADLTNGIPRRSSVKHYIDIVRERAGQRYAMHVAEAIQHAAQAGGNVGELTKRFSEAGEQIAGYSALPNGAWRDIFHTYEDFQNAPPLSFAIEGVVQEGGIGIIAGLVGNGKTLALLALVQAMLTGKPLFDFFAVPRRSERVVYLVPESALSPFWARLQMFRLDGFVQSGELLVRTLSAKEQVSLSDSRILQAVEGADVILDTVVRFFEGSENDADSSRAFADVLFKLLGAGARTITAAHHSPKSFENADRMTLENALRGSGDIGAMLSTAWGIRQVDAAANRIYVQNLKARDFQPCEPFVIEGRPHLDQTGHFKMTEAPGTAGELREYIEHRKGGAPPLSDKGEKLQRALEMRAGGSSVRMIASALGVSKSAIQKWLGEYDSRLSTNLSTVDRVNGHGSIPEGGKTQ